MKNHALTLIAVPFLFLTACGEAGMSQSVVESADQTSEAFIKVGTSSTFLKKSTADSSGLDLGSEKCVLPAGSKILLKYDPTAEGAHLLVDNASALPDCQFTKGYVYRPHVAASSMKALFSENVSAFLDTIAYAEGTGDSYNYMFTHKIFYGYSDHPRQIQCSYGLCSDAAGRYQFLSTTWDAMRRKLSLPDFSPESQDRAAVQIIKDVGCYSSVANINGPETFSRAAYCVSGQWASFPGSPYGQPRHSSSHLYGKFIEFLKRH